MFLFLSSPLIFGGSGTFRGSCAVAETRRCIASAMAASWAQKSTRAPIGPLSVFLPNTPSLPPRGTKSSVGIGRPLLSFIWTSAAGTYSPLDTCPSFALKSAPGTIDTRRLSCSIHARLSSSQRSLSLRRLSSLRIIATSSLRRRLRVRLVLSSRPLSLTSCRRPSSGMYHLFISTCGREPVPVPYNMAACDTSRERHGRPSFVVTNRW